jgi:hypothetical protein
VQKDEFLRLMTPEALNLLDTLQYDEKADVVATVSALRAAGHDAGLVAAVLNQAKLRRRARAKFGEFADRMLFTEAGLEQATRLSVAALHAGRFKDADIASVADLGCGIGAESLALASLGITVEALEIDEVTAAVASYNLAAFENASVQNSDVTHENLDRFEGLFFDPARRELNGPKRANATRKFDPADYSPNFDWVLGQVRSKASGVKLGPGHPHEGIPVDCEAQWVSVDGDLVECTLWFGSLAREGVARSALLLRNGAAHELKSASMTRKDAPLGELHEFLYEPDAAVIRSHLVGDLAESLDANIFAAEIAYLSSAAHTETPFAKSYRVIDNLPFDRKKLKAYLREREVGVLAVKKRGVEVVPEELRKEMQLKGANAATIVITKVGDARRVLVVDPF